MWMWTWGHKTEFTQELLIQLKQKCHVKSPFAVSVSHCQEIAFWNWVLKFNLRLIELTTHIWKGSKREKKKKLSHCQTVKKGMLDLLRKKYLDFNLFQGHSQDIVRAIFFFFSYLRKVTHLYSDSHSIVLLKTEEWKTKKIFNCTW